MMRMVRSSWFLPVLAGVFATILAAFCLWQAPGVVTGRLTATEIDRYLGAVDRQILMPETERSGLIARLREWAEADDGGPVYMLNLMRYHDEVERFPGAPEFSGTPQQANAHYEDIVIPMLLGDGGYPIFGGRVTGANAVGGDAPGLDDWSRVLVVRYPSRRAFLELLSNPEYAPVEPYKFMAMEVLLVPTAAEILVPDARFVLAMLLVVSFLTIGWARQAAG